jgi:hypothetical protein
MKKETARTLRAFAIELVIYAPLVVAYFFLVLHFLGGWLYQLESVAILLMIGQALVLQNVTTLLLRFIRRRAS